MAEPFSARALCAEEVGEDGAPAFRAYRDDVVPIMARHIVDLIEGRVEPTRREGPWLEAAAKIPVEAWEAVATGETPLRLDGPELKATALDLCKKLCRARLREEVLGPFWFVWDWRGDERFLPRPGIQSKAPTAVASID